MRLHIIVLFALTIFTTISCAYSPKIKKDSSSNKSIVCNTHLKSCSPNKLSNTETQTLNTAKAMKLIYYYDPLCGWCYGFSPVIKKLKETYNFDIEVVSGGLFLGNRAGLINQVAPHIKAGAYKSVEALTGVKFGTVFLNDVFGEGKMTLNSLYPTIALCIIKEKFPEKELEFAATLLKAVYYDGINPIHIEKFIPYVEKIGISADEFIFKMNSEKYLQLAHEEYKKYKSSPYSGMPSLVLKQGNREIPIANGYVSYQQLKYKLDQLVTVYN